MSLGTQSNHPEFPDSSFRSYMSELAAEIVAAGDATGDMLSDMQAAHERRQAVAQEMAAGKTERAKIARRVLAAKVWGNVQAGVAMDSAIRGLYAELRPDRSHEEMVAILEGGAA